MNGVADRCQLCRVTAKLPWHGIEICVVCDNPPFGEATWFTYWRYSDGSED